ncbi:cysteine hydrolase [Streptomyces sulphureus]|uniref:cysteine hydrolase n=1 Tax=Streptomyces sulphureus TaxID=47758 RepID=UPI000381862C|nr:cysteine hydrolase [Streptomyces sulphureus]
MTEAPSTEPLTAPALVISECQRGILDPDRSVSGGLAAHAASRGIVPRIARLAGEFRSRGLPVVHCTIAHRQDQAGMVANSYLGKVALRERSMTEGTRDVEIPPELAPHPSDLVSNRATGITAFYGTELDAMLRLQRVRTLVLTGVSTNVALPGLAFEAVNRGYHVVVAEDCTAGASPEAHTFLLENQLGVAARIRSAEQIRARLG